MRIARVFPRRTKATPNDELAFCDAKLSSVGFDRHHIRAYVLIGYPKDTIDDAEKRLLHTVHIGVSPMAMLWRNADGKRDPNWARFQRRWARPAMIYGSAA